MKQALTELIYRVVAEEFGEDVIKDVSFTVSYPPKPDMGDYSTNVAMVVAQKLKLNPKDVAGRLVESLKVHQVESESLERVEALGGFVNFTLKSEIWFKEVLEAVSSEQSAFGTSQSSSPEKIMVEYLSPNTNKPLHLGHLRNGVTGVATINALAAQGHAVTKVGIINDRGVHICKAMLAYSRWGDGSTPESTGKKPDHFVGDWYVRFAQEAVKDPTLETEAQEMLQKWEAGDDQTRELWQTLRQWVLDGWIETEATLGFSYDKPYYESDVYLGGKDLVNQGLSKGVFRKNGKGNVVFDLPELEFGKDEEGNARLITVLRSDGTSLYTTQDLGLAVTRAEEYHLDRLIYIVGSEQRFHFQSLFAILKALGYAWANKLYHLWYGMVYLPDGKMKSREGTVVDADDLVTQMIDLARQEIIDRANRTNGKDVANNRIEEVEIERRAKIIALGAIKFYLLKQKPTVDIHFDPKESISFEGHTGPYCQYAYARAKSIERSAESRIKNQVVRDPEGSGDPRRESRIKYELLGDTEERILLQKLESFPEVVSRAAEEYNPALIATHVFETAQAFNSFYTSHPVLQAETTELMSARLRMVDVSAQVIKNGLALLGIEAPEEM